jgi:ribosomal-protein-alanine N-acetyltransferase
MAGWFTREVRIEGRNVCLRPPRLSDHAEWAQLRLESRNFLEPWEPRWTEDELSRSAWRRRLRQIRREHRAGRAQSFLVIEKATGRIAGGISLMNIRRGVAQSAEIGYWMGERFAGKGYMVESLALLRDYCFSSLNLQRIEAACVPENHRSAHVLEKAGFAREGLMRSYLCINGKWRDHLLYALIASDCGETGKPGRRD